MKIKIIIMAGIIIAAVAGVGLIAGTAIGGIIGLLVPSLKISLLVSLVIGGSTYWFSRKNNNRAYHGDPFAASDFLFVLFAGYTAAVMVALGPLLRVMLVESSKIMYENLMESYDVLSLMIKKSW